jgi:hypothetical protein
MPNHRSRGLLIAGLLVFIPQTFAAPSSVRAQAPRPAGARAAADPAPPGSPPGSGAPPPAATSPTSPPDASRTDALERRVKDLEARLKKLQQAQEDAEVGQMVMEGKVEASAPEPKTFKTKVFTGHHRGQQGLNPEISVTGDLAGTFLLSGGKEYTATERSGFQFRGLGLHFESALDPFSYMKAAFSISPSGVSFGEAYAVWTNVAGFMNITAGQFRQQLGVLNRWHKHALDQWDFPLMLTEPFGPAGLNQIGLSFDFLLGKLIAHATELTVQITNSMNAKAFSGNYFSVPTTLVYLKNYWDLTRSTYLELGLTGIVGSVGVKVVVA